MESSNKKSCLKIIFKLFNSFKSKEVALKRKYSATEINSMTNDQFLRLIKRIEKNPYYTTNSSVGFRGVPKSLLKKRI